MTNQKIRKQFEKWAKSRSLDITGRVDTWSCEFKYDHEHIQSMWTGWQAALSSPQWMPIETAPTEWGSYLVWHKSYGMETLWFQLKDGGLDNRKSGNWYSEDADEDDCPKNYRVSHWMPLPPAPSPSEES